MSLTYNLVCRDCRKALWVSQDRRMYRGEGALNELEVFLYEHESHILTFIEENELSDLKSAWAKDEAMKLLPAAPER
jgi:hypothetical protein